MNANFTSIRKKPEVDSSRKIDLKIIENHHNKFQKKRVLIFYISKEFKLLRGLLIKNIHFIKPKRK